MTQPHELLNNKTIIDYYNYIQLRMTYWLKILINNILFFSISGGARAPGSCRDMIKT